MIELDWALCGVALFILFQTMLTSRQTPAWIRRPSRPAPSITAAAASSSQRGRRKPPWVARRVLRLKALAPQLSTRTIAEVFNRRFEHAQAMTVSKSYVADLLKREQAQLILLRRTIKRRIPPAMPNNRVWGIDLTGKQDLSGRQRIILGVIDHGSRAALRLQAIADKRSLTILRELIATFRRYGIPNAIRTDNEACLVSRTMRTAFAMLGITHQRSDPHCPWQNGRIERLFGTLKGVLDRIAVVDGAELALRLQEFRVWYNHVRSHQHLHGRTPAEAWSGRSKSRRRPEWFDAWEGRLTGWFFPP